MGNFAQTNQLSTLMKKFCTLFTIFNFAFVALLNAQISESEPNDNLASANEIALNTELSGQLCMWNNEDWFEIVLPEDGQLKITTTSAGEAENPPVAFQFQLYSAAGNPWNAFDPETGNFGQMITDSSGWCCLKAGTFYMQVYSGYVYEYCYDYSVVLELLPATFQDDAEPNSSVNDNLVLIPYNTATEGHVSFITNPQAGGTDNYDFFKIAPPINGMMRLFIETEAQSTGSNALFVMVHDIDGNPWYQQSSIVGEFGLPASDTLYYDCTPDDSLIVSLYTSNYFDRGYAYRLRYDIVAPAFENDVEPNNVQATAQLIDLATPVSGNQYYFEDNSEDIYKFYKPDTGFFKVRLTSTTNSSDGSLGTKLQLLDHNFSYVSQLNAAIGINGDLVIDSLYIQYLDADTFYIKVYSDYAYAACRSYLLEFSYNDIQDAVQEADQIAVPIYPNPANDHFFIDTRNLQGASKMQIVNAMGEVVVDRNFTNSGLHQVDMSTSAPGVYYIILKNDSIRLTRSVVIK